MSIRVVASDFHILIEIVVQSHLVARMLQHRAYQAFGQTVNVPTRFDITGQQPQERGNGWIFMLGIGTGHNDFIVAKLDSELAASMGTKRLPDGLGQGGLPSELTLDFW